MSTDRGGRAVGSGPCDQNPSGRGVASLGQRPLSAVLAGGIFRGHQTQKLHEFLWALTTRQVTHVRHQGHGHGQWHPTPSLEGFAHRGHTPRWHVLMACVFQTLEAFAVCMDGADLFLQDHWLRRGGTDHRREPPQVGRAPLGPARGTPIVSEQAGFEPERGVFASAQGLFTCPREVAHRCLFALGDLHGSASP